MAEELKACRYRVEKTGYGFWPYCVRAGDGTRELFRGHKKQCMVVAAELETAFEDGKFVSACNKLPIQGGEAVEVVGYGCAGQIEVLKHVPLTGGMKVSGREREKYNVPLMTVAQHQRILAASVGSGEPVATYMGTDWASQSQFMAQCASLEPGTDLYTHPADQVEDDLTMMVKVSRELLRKICELDFMGIDASHEVSELRALLAKP